MTSLTSATTQIRGREAVGLDVDTDGLNDVRGKVALVTGGTSGIGLVVARTLAAAGVRTYVTSRSAESSAGVAGEISNSTGGTALGLRAELSSEEGCEELVDAITARETSLHILVNNAGATWGAPFDQFPYGAWERTFMVNVAGPFELVRRLHPMLEKAGEKRDPARVINIGSIDGVRVSQLPAFSYGASKAALHHLTKVLACELGPSGIAVNTIAPGPFPSKMMRATLSEYEQSYLEGTPLGRLGTDDDIAGLVLFLSARASAFVTGALIALDGGLSLRG